MAPQNTRELRGNGWRQHGVTALQALQALGDASVASSWRYKRCKLLALQVLQALSVTSVASSWAISSQCCSLQHYRLTTLQAPLLEIWHFATILCNWFSVACDTCNWKFAQLPKTSCMKFVVTCNSRIIQVHTIGLYGFIHPYSILAVGRATACNYRGCVHIALHVN